jgi:hypothetical protein
MRRASTGLAVLACTTLLAGTSRAQSVPAIDVGTWAPSVDPRANAVLEPPSSPGPWSFAAGSFLHYANDSVLLRTPAGAIASRPLENQLGLDLVGSLGLGSHGLVGVRAPAVLVEQGSGGLSPAVDSSHGVPVAALGDLAVDAKATILGDDLGGVGLAALGEVTLPTGAKTSFASDRGPTLTVRTLFDLSVQVASLQASVGYKVRTSHVEWPSAGGITFGNEIPWTLGVVVRPALVHPLDPDGRQSWEVALHGALPGGPVLPFGAGASGSAAESPVLLTFSDRVALGRFKDAFVLAGVDVGLDRAVGVPSVRAMIGLGFRLANHDRDGDGIGDDVDQCPGLPEDFDGFEDSDGCPEADNDEDGIVDAEDACPNVPGVRSPDPRKNGCPPDALAPGPPVHSVGTP